MAGGTPPADPDRITTRPARQSSAPVRAKKRRNHLDKKLHQLETFSARGSDGRTYTVRGYEHLARLETMGDPHGLWEPTGEAEYKLDDGRPVRVDRNGDMTVIGTDLTLRR